MIFPIVVHSDLNFYAKWEIIVSAIPYHTNGGVGVELSKIILSRPIKNGYSFKGWYENKTFEGSRIKEISLSDMMIGKEYWAKWKKRPNKTGFYETNEFGLDNNYLYFGEFPQTVVDDTQLIAKLTNITSTNIKGYYEYKGNQYAKLYAVPEAIETKFWNGSTIMEGIPYFFKVEPIKWRILFNYNGIVELMSEYSLTNKRFDENSNIYADSEIRQYLNDTFYNNVFSSKEQNDILTTDLEDVGTSDKMYLLSWDDYLEPVFDFQYSRCSKATDYARANGLNPPYFLDGGVQCWTRTVCPNNDGDLNEVYIVISGDAESARESKITMGIRPAFGLKSNILFYL